jgi:hypothetical protein
MVASLPSSAGQAGTSDMFLVEYFKDANNNNVFIIYGFAWKGTYIGGVFFKTYILPNIASFTHGWYIYQWNDVNGNGLPDPYEVNTTLLRGPPDPNCKHPELVALRCHCWANETTYRCMVCGKLLLTSQLRE